jgi:5-methylcytosine-specific restriction protein A
MNCVLGQFQPASLFVIAATIHNALIRITCSLELQRTTWPTETRKGAGEDNLSRGMIRAEGSKKGAPVPKRKRLSLLARTRIFDSASGICCLCSAPIWAASGERFIVEHLKPLWLGGPDDEANMAPAHYLCAIDKTRSEAPVKAKSDRQRAKHLGIRKRSRFRGSRDDVIKKKVSGEVVPR